MSQSIIETLTAVSDALATWIEPDQLARVAAQAIMKTLGCQAAVIWLVAREGRLGWLRHLEHVPGVERVVRGLWRNGSNAEDTQLRLASTPNRRRHVWRRLFSRKPDPGPFEGLLAECTTLATLTGGQVSTMAELAAMRSHALWVDTPDSDQDLCLVAGLFRADEPVGVLACTWARADETTSSLREVLVVCLANYLGQVFGDQSALSPETDVYLAGTGLLLTALDVGSPAARECAEVVTRSALKMAAGRDLPPAEVQSLQWAALFHEVGRAPMDRWLTFPSSDDDEGDSHGLESSHQSCLALIPDLQSAANLLTQVAPVLDGQARDLGSDTCLPARLLAEAWLSSHCGPTQSSAESAVHGSVGKSIQTGEPWDTISPDIETFIPENLNTPAPQAR